MSENPAGVKIIIARLSRQVEYDGWASVVDTVTEYRTTKFPFFWTRLQLLTARNTFNFFYTIIIIVQGRMEGNVLFNDALNTFYLQLYGVRHMVKYHTDSERKFTAATLSD